MDQRIIKLQLLLLIIASFCMSKNAYTIEPSQVLITEHFNISFDNNNVNAAAAIAVRLESYHELISTFLETEIMHKVNVSLVPADDKNSPMIRKSNELYICSDGNFNDPEKNIYHDLSVLYMKNITNEGRTSSAIDEVFIRTLMNYTAADPKFTELVINDLVNNCGINSIEVNNIKTFDDSIQFSIYTALINFITSAYSKKILIQSIKDADHYDGFHKSLSEITGESEKIISEKFNKYLLKHKSDLQPDPGMKKSQFKYDEDFADICFAISKRGQLAVLQKNGTDYRILLKSGESENIIIPDNSENGSLFNDIEFAGNDKIALTEIRKSGSTVQIYDIQTGKISGKVSLPYLFISDISYMENGKFILSAGCGLTNDIYILDMTDGKFTVITESGNNFSPVMLNNKVYYISNTVKSNIMEYDTKSGVIKTLFSTDQKISHLNIADGENLIFSLKFNGLENIYTIAIPSGNLRRLTNDITSDISPLIYGKNIYYMSFFKSRYRLFTSEYNPAVN